MNDHGTSGAGRMSTEHGARLAWADAIVLCVLFLLSGFSALVYQLVWTQQFALVFGSAASATAAVLAAFLGGLGLGAALITRRLHRIRSPVRWYAALELGIAIGALLVIPGLEAARWAYAASFPFVGQHGGSSAFYLLGAFAILVVPTALMGATLPLLVRFWVARPSQISRGVASLYMVNTLGAAAGAVVTGFVLIPRLGLGSTLAVAVTINLLVAGLAGWWFRSAKAAPTISTAEPVPALSASDTSDTRWRRAAPWMYPLAACSGLVGVSYEIYWTRILSHPLGGSLFAFATMLAAFLLGIAVGSFATTIRRWSRRGAWIGFAWVQVALALVAPFTLGVLNGGLVDSLDLRGLTTGSVVAVGIALLPGALLLGAAFPLAVRAVSGSAEGAATGTGKVYAWNTVGTILGSVLCGFWLLPWLQFEGTLRLLVAVSLCAAGVAFFLAGGRWRVAAAGTATMLLAVAFWTPTTPWAVLGRSAVQVPFTEANVRFFGVGRSATIIVQQADGELRLSSNGLPESVIEGPGGRPGRYSVARWLALLPSALRPEAERAMVIGMGAGITAGSFPGHVRQIDVAEIEPEVIRANRAFSSWRRDDPLADPRIRIIEGDARNLLFARPDTYDLIVSQPSHPWTLGSANLFTREFYRLVSSRLDDDGVFTQWMGLRYVDVPLLRTLVATLLEEFRFVEVMRPPPTGAALFVASNAPIDIDAAARTAWESWAEDWRQAAVDAPGVISLSRWIDHPSTRRFAEGSALSTDYRNLLLTRSSWVRRAGARRFAELDAFDAVRSWQSARSDLFAVRRLLTWNQVRRAHLALDGVTDPRLREVGRALLDLADGNASQGLLVLDRLSRSPDLPENVQREALSALLIAQGNRAAGVSPELAERLTASPLLQMVYRSWTRFRLGDWGAVRDHDAQLAAIDPEHPIYPMALRLRVLWRQRSGNETSAREALDLIEPMISQAPGLAPLLLRARLARSARDDEALWASLLEIAAFGGRRAKSSARQLQALLSELSQSPSFRNDSRYEELQRLLETDRRAHPP